MKKKMSTKVAWEVKLSARIFNSLADFIQQVADNLRQKRSIIDIEDKLLTGR